MLFNCDYLRHHVSLESKIVFVTFLFWLIAKIISWKVWTSYRLFPLVPAFEFLNDLPFLYHVILFLVSIFCLTILLIRPSAVITIILIVSELLSVTADQNRLQPWEYQYLFITLMVWLNRKKQKYLYSLVVFIVAAIYFYSGIGKVNAGFLHTVWSDLILHRLLRMDIATAHSSILYYAGYGIGLTEAVCAIGLIFKTFKKISSMILIIMHCLNLLILGPLGINYNQVIWPWNLAMIAYLYVLFISFPVPFFDLRYITVRWNNLVLICWGFLPTLYFFGWWDTYLSSMLYTGRVKQMVICLKNLNDTTAKSLELFYNTDYKNICNGDKMIGVTSWALKELKVPVYPEKRMYLRIKESLIKKYPSIQIRFYLFTYYLNEREELK